MKLRRRVKGFGENHPNIAAIVYGGGAILLAYLSGGGVS
jgi:hypothetical protein